MTAFAVGALGLADVALGVCAPRAAPVMFVPLLPLGDTLAASICGLALLLLAGGLARGSRPAWIVTLALLVEAALIAPIDHAAQALLALVPVALLWLRRAEFTATARALRRGCAAALVGVFLFSAAGAAMHARHIHRVHTTFISVVRAADADDRVMVRRAVTLPARPGVPVLPLMGAGALFLLLGVRGLALPALPRSGADESHARARARRLFEAHGANSVGYFAATDHTTLWSDPLGRGVVPFRVVGATALVAGDPLAAPRDLPAALDGFLAHCHARGWTAAFYQTLDATLELYRARGFKALTIGREAIIDLPAFTLTGKRIANVRHSVTHAERAGLRVRLYDEDTLDAATRAELAAISAEWLARKGGAQMGFTMGTLAPDGRPTPGARVAVAYGPDERVSAFITLVPAGGGRGWMLDLMRRRLSAESGTMDLLIARTAEALRDEGFATFSLSLAPLADDAAAHEDAPRVARRARTLLYEHMSGAYNYRSLFSYKNKFNVRWEARYLIYAGDAHLPAALYATVRAHMPATLASLLPLTPSRAVLGRDGARSIFRRMA